MQFDQKEKHLLPVMIMMIVDEGMRHPRNDGKEKETLHIRKKIADDDFLVVHVVPY